MVWWKNFFGRNFLTFGLKPREEKAKKEVDFLVDVLDLPRRAKILDLACGAGRHSMELAKRGYRVVGVDFNKEHLEYAKKKAKKFRVKVEFIQCDMIKLDFVGQFDAVINMFTSFGYFDTEEENFKVLENVATALKNGGKFLIDTANRDYILKHFEKMGWGKVDEGYILEERDFDFSTNHVKTKWTFFSDKKREIVEKESSVRMYSLHELKAMFERVGLRLVKGFGGFEKEEISPDAKRLILIAQKR